MIQFIIIIYDLPRVWCIILQQMFCSAESIDEDGNNNSNRIMAHTSYMGFASRKDGVGGNNDVKK